MRIISTFQTNFKNKLLAHFCTLLAGNFSIATPFLSQWIEIEMKIIVIVYRRAIMVGCSENNIKFPR